jgi:hypothetical protein
MGSGSTAFNSNWRNSAPSEYVDAIVARFGEERAAQVLGTAWRMNIFPNVCFATNEIRVIRPIAVDAYEFVQYHVNVPGMTESQQRSAIQRHQGFHGQAGYGVPDDFELVNRMKEGYRSSDFNRLNRWASFTRGLTSETRGPNGERFGPVNSEVEQRANYYAWSALMKGESHIVATDPAGGETTAQAALQAGRGPNSGSAS